MFSLKSLGGSNGHPTVGCGGRRPTGAAEPSRQLERQRDAKGLEWAPSGLGSKEGLRGMPELARFFGIIIRMFTEPPGPHHRPHFHA